MKKQLIILLWLSFWTSIYASHIKRDWLIDGSSFIAQCCQTDSTVVISNGLVSRKFSISPNCATIAYDNLMTGNSELRAVRPEAIVVLNDKSYNVGGLIGQPVHNYLSTRFLNQMRVDSLSFKFSSVKIDNTQARFDWSPNTKWISTSFEWPAKGVRVQFEYKASPYAPKEIQDVVIHVIYELYNGAPILSKQIQIENKGASDVVINSFTSEVLALVETAPKVHYGEPHEARMMAMPAGYFTQDYRKRPVQTDAPRDYIDRFTQLFVVTDYAMGGDMEAMKDNPAVRWVFDHPEYEYTGIRYYGQYKPARLEVKPPFGPDLKLLPNKSFLSYTTFEMLRDATDQERRGLSECRFWRMMAPWVQENPIFMHVKESNQGSVRQAVDQCAEVGFEMVVMTFGSGFNIENTEKSYLDTMKNLAAYAASKDIVLGGYSLLASRSCDDSVAVISQHSGMPAHTREDGVRFGKTPCIATEWGHSYFETLHSFFNETKMGVFEHDGSYPGDPCASNKHSGHTSYTDSQWMQWTQINQFYNWCRSQGIYLNVPDWYFLSGSNKTPMGYVETNWSLPRAYQEIIERQNIYDGTWQKTPTMGYMFVPLTQYHGGGTAATIEPLCEHLDHYEARLQNLFGAGVQACYRGPRLFDTPKTRDLVTKWVSFYKQYRSILDSDIIHLRRPDGNDWDGILHVNPHLDTKGFASIYNPLDIAIERTITLPLYYTGLTDQAHISISGNDKVMYHLNRDYSITIKLRLEPKSFNWITIE